MTTNSEYTKVIKFFVELNDSYSNARSQIIMKKTVPDLSEVYDLLDQDFSRTSINPISNASDFHADGSHCGYNGHTIIVTNATRSMAMHHDSNTNNHKQIKEAMLTNKTLLLNWWLHR